MHISTRMSRRGGPVHLSTRVVDLAWHGSPPGHSRYHLTSTIRSAPSLHPLPPPGSRKLPSLLCSLLAICPSSISALDTFNIATCCSHFPHLRPSKSLFVRSVTLDARAWRPQPARSARSVLPSPRKRPL
ncbi:hypothetical protein BV22DRAFT_898987 [Leucogyrophana mollusca]|uniref:Uncharacterized protein n=1 Tax=Leucogyrophana mollusca TaxID=85980 RepID=A0ACB8B206_9AGAM|nr:hypothetical protein BV22DRAFT_898987 [Leucogyrophana mollusca]